MLNWVRASKFLKDLAADTDEATKAFAHVLTGSEGLGLALHGSCDKVNVETIRQARVRLDFVACLAFREFFKRTDLRATWFNLFADGSPQWRGTEMFATSVDITSSGWHSRKLLPCVTLNRSSLSSVSKAFALLWQIF